MRHTLNALAIQKADGERYVFLYDNESSRALMQTLSRFAGEPELGFSWYDAAVLSQSARRMQMPAATEPAKKP